MTQDIRKFMVRKNSQEIDIITDKSGEEVLNSEKEIDIAIDLKGHTQN